MVIFLLPGQSMEDIENVLNCLLNCLPNILLNAGAPNSAKFRGVAEGQPRFDKGGVALIFYFLRVKNITF